MSTRTFRLRSLGSERRHVEAGERILDEHSAELVATLREFLAHGGREIQVSLVPSGDLVVALPGGDDDHELLFASTGFFVRNGERPQPIDLDSLPGLLSQHWHLAPSKAIGERIIGHIVEAVSATQKVTNPVTLTESAS